MKKIVVAFLALSSISLANQNVNVYGKFGVDLHSRYSNTSEIDSEGMEAKLGFSQNGKSSMGIFLEGTKNITPNFELGLGLGYINRKNGSAVSALSGIETAQYGSIITKHLTYDYYQSVAYDSIPLYVTAKYNFDVKSNIKPYVKVDLGYSFNHMKKDSLQVEQIEYDENSQVIGRGSYKVGLKAKNGVYLGIGTGIEYNNFLVELAYIQNAAKVKATYTGPDFDGGEETYSYKYNNHAVRLLLGYKFNF